MATEGPVGTSAESGHPQTLEGSIYNTLQTSAEELNLLIDPTFIEGTVGLATEIFKLATRRQGGGRREVVEELKDRRRLHVLSLAGINLDEVEEQNRIEDLPWELATELADHEMVLGEESKKAQKGVIKARLQDMFQADRNTPPNQIH